MAEFFQNLFTPQNLSMFAEGTLVTLKVTLAVTLISYLIGIPLGVLLYCTSQGGIFQNKPVNAVLGFIVNVLRSIPFVILLLMTQPLAKIVVGSLIGDNTFIFHLVLAAAPFVARMIESSLREVDPGVIEAAQAHKGTYSRSQAIPYYRRGYRNYDNSRIYSHGVPHRRRRSRSDRYPVRSVPPQLPNYVCSITSAHYSCSSYSRGAQPSREKRRQENPWKMII